MNAQPTQRGVLRSQVRGDNDVVLAGAALRPGTDPARLSHFGDDRWDMRPGIFRDNVRRSFQEIDFLAIPCPAERLTAKEYLYALLNERRTDWLAPQPVSCWPMLSDLRRFATFVRSRLGTFDVPAIKQDLLDAYLAMLRSGHPITCERISARLAPIMLLHRFGPVLTLGGLRFAPWGGRTAGRVAGRSRPNSRENLTPRIPEPVIGALLRWSLKYIDHFSQDILAARAELDQLRQDHATRHRHPYPGSELRRMQTWIEARRQAGRGIPVWSVERPCGTYPRVSARDDSRSHMLNYALIRLQTGLAAVNLQQNEAVWCCLWDAVAELGTEIGGFDTPVSDDPDLGRPWRERFDPASLACEEKHLQAACYIVVAYLSGMRDTELQAMQPGCLARSRSADGLVERIVVRSIAYKDRPARGQLEEWVTIAPAARAIEVSERLSAPFRAQQGHAHLWCSLDRTTTLSRGFMSASRRMNAFRAHLDRQFSDAANPAVPEVAGRPWPLNTRQFRRTIAWWIANRPFGVVAGKIQYKHASIAMFQGYAGSSASGFRAEIEQERALGQLDDALAHYEHTARRNQPLAGPAAGRLAAEFHRARDVLEDLPGRVVDEAQLRAMLAHLARTLHAGLLNDCFFDPGTALCLDTARDSNPAAPRLSQCAPDRCPNSCISVRHLPAWQAAIAQTEELLARKRLPPLQRIALNQERDRMRRLIAPLAKAGSG